jgi:hypothetical protein
MEAVEARVIFIRKNMPKITTKKPNATPVELDKFTLVFCTFLPYTTMITQF